MKVSGAGANIENEKKNKNCRNFFFPPGFVYSPGKVIFLFFMEVSAGGHFRRPG